jgi:hypothetical protein
MTATAVIAASIDFPGFPMTRFPRWFDFSQSNHQGSEIVNKASKFSARLSHTAARRTVIVDN